MEVFTNEVHLRTSDQFPDKISPFPSSFDSLLSVSESRVSTSFPPQKLRPIRCNGKSSLVYHDNNAEAFGFRVCDEFGAVRVKSSLEEGGLGQLGFVSNLRDEILEGGQVFREPDVDMDVKRIGKFEQFHLPNSSSSSESKASEDQLLEKVEGSVNRKRRRTRTRRKRLEGYMEEVVSNFLLKQEMMHNKLMEMLERKERERLVREEAWKQHEMERLRREEQVRAQETARNVAFIEFIQEMMGKDIQMAKPSKADNTSKDEAGVYQQRDLVVDDDDKILSQEG